MVMKAYKWLLARSVLPELRTHQQEISGKSSAPGLVVGAAVVVGRGDVVGAAVVVARGVVVITVHGIACHSRS